MSWIAALNFIIALFFGAGHLPPVSSIEAPILKPKPNVPALEIKADKGAALIANDHLFLFSKRGDDAQPIASITKLMTALVFLDNNPGWDKIYKIVSDDHVEGGRLNLFLGDEVKVKDLFYTSLVASDNGATLALVHATGLSEKDFVAQMNVMAKKLGLVKTSFVDPIGLSDNNVSTAREVALLAQAALDREEIREATTRQSYQFKTLLGRDKKVESTDYLLSDSSQGSLQVMGGKTGYTEQAGYCFVGRLRDASGREVISAVLNSSGKNERFEDSRNLANWVFNSYNWNK